MTMLLQKASFNSLSVNVLSDEYTKTENLLGRTSSTILKCSTTQSDDMGITKIYRQLILKKDLFVMSGGSHQLVAIQFFSCL